MPVLDLLNPNAYLKDKQIVRERRQKCNDCPERKAAYDGKPLNKTQQCPLCHCFMFAKTLLRTEQCPLGDW